MIELNLFIAFVVAASTSFYSTSVGGGGLIMLPLLIFLGLSPQVAVATMITGYLGLIIIGYREFYKADKIDHKIVLPITLIATIGGIIGALMLPNLPADLLKKIIGAFILFVVIMSVVKPGSGIEKGHTSKLKKAFRLPLFFLIGIYATAIGGGASILATYALIFLFGQTYLESAGTRKPIFLGVDLVAALIFFVQGIIHWPYAIMLLIGTSIGSYFGVHHALKKGEAWVKWLFIIIVVISGIKLIV